MSWMLTASGRKLNPVELDATDITIEDIAAHLAKLCRFTGACRIMWSVAEHSVLVSEIIGERYPDDFDLQLCGLLHDAPEYVLQDVSTPVKALIAQAYKPIEYAAWWAVASRFGLPLQLPRQVEHADLVALATERRDLMPPHPEPWSVLEGIGPCAKRHLGVKERHWKEAETLFLECFHYLQTQRAAAGARTVI